MDGVESLGLRARQPQTLLRDDAQTGTLNLSNDLSGKIAPSGIRLNDRERTLDGHKYLRK
jgi:hypothetical protein